MSRLATRLCLEAGRITCRDGGVGCARDRAFDSQRLTVTRARHDERNLARRTRTGMASARKVSHSAHYETEHGSQRTAVIAVWTPAQAALAARMGRHEGVCSVFRVGYCVAEAAVARDGTDTALLTTWAAPFRDLALLQLLESGFLQASRSPVGDTAQVERSVTASLHRRHRLRGRGIRR